MIAGRRLKASALAIALAAGLAGCAAVGPEFKTPAPPAANTYPQASDITAPGAVEPAVGDAIANEWWTLFQSPDIDRLVRLALKRSPTLAAARARLEAAEAASRADGAVASVTGTAGAKTTRANLSAFSGGAFNTSQIPGGFVFPTNPEYGLYTLALGGQYDFDVFGGRKRLREALRADAEAERRAYEAAALSLTNDVVVQALTIGNANVRKRELEAVVAWDRTILDMLVRARSAGGVTDADIESARASLAEDEALVPPQAQRRAAARHRLAALLGYAPSEFDPPDLDEKSGILPARIPVAVPSDLVRERPDIREAEAQLHAAVARVGVATADLYPSVTLTGNLSQDGLTITDLFKPVATSWGVGPGVKLPLFDQGELRARRREAQAKADQALAVYQQTVLNAFVQVDDAMQSMAHDNQTYDSAVEVQAAAAARLEMAKKAQAAGGVSALKVAQAERDVARAKLTVVDLGSGRVADAALLLLATARAPVSGEAGSPGASHPAP